MEKKSRQYGIKYSLISSRLNAAIADLEVAYDLANDLGLEKTVEDIDAIQHEIETIIREVK